MKKLFSAFYLVIAISAGFCQNHKIYFKTGGQIAFAYGTRNLNLNSVFYNLEIQDFENFSVNNGKTENIDVSLGKGINFGIGGGYEINKYITTEINFSFLQGSSYTATREMISEKVTSKLSSKLFQLTPAVIFQMGEKNISPYIKVGGIMATGSVLHRQKIESNSYLQEMDVKFNKGISWGIEGDVGVCYSFNKHYAAGFEIRFTSLSYTPKRGEIVKLETDGVDMLYTVPDNLKRFELYDLSEKRDTWDERVFKYKFPFGSIGIGIFLKIQ
jgi:outer membrane protein W